MMRSQQALAYDAPGYLRPSITDQIFSAHGTLMIFFRRHALRHRADETSSSRCSSASGTWRSRR